MKYKLIEIILKIYNFFNKKQKNLQEQKESSKNNKIVLIKKDGTKVINPKINGLNVTFTGKNNYIELREPFEIRGKVNIFASGDNGVFCAKESFRPKTLHVSLSNNSKILIGTDFSCERIFLSTNLAPNTAIKIGNDCMFSVGVVVRSGDAHVVYDKDTKQVLNPDSDVEIGNHCWIAWNCQILKGSKIPNGSIVGGHSFVNKKFEEESCVIAGTPAKVVKRNIGWDRRSPSEWSELIK